jgi:hypothetical protein
MKYTFNLPGRTPSLNKTMAMHWAERCKLKTEWTRKIVVVMGLTQPTGKMRVKYTSYRKKLLDMTNLAGGMKQIEDALVKCGWLKDDSPTWCEVEYAQVQSANEYLRIDLEDLGVKEAE